MRRPSRTKSVGGAPYLICCGGVLVVSASCWSWLLYFIISAFLRL